MAEKKKLIRTKLFLSSWLKKCKVSFLGSRKKRRYIFLLNDIIKIFVLFVTYFITAKIGLSMQAVSGFATLLWVPTGISIAALFIYGYRFWPGIALAAFTVNLETGAPVFAALGISIGNTLEAIIAVYLLHRFTGLRNPFLAIKDVISYLIFVVLLSTMVSATLGVTSLWLSGIVTTAAYWKTWFFWWMGDLFGALIIAPFLIEWIKEKRSGYLVKKDIMKIILIILASILIIGINYSRIVSGKSILFYLFFIPLIWSVISFGVKGAVTGSFIFSLISLLTVIKGLGPFITGTLEQNLLATELFRGITAVILLILAAVITENKSLNAGLEKKLGRFKRLESE